MWRAVVERHASAMWEKKLHSNIEEKPSHKGRHGSAMSRHGSAMAENCFYCNVEETLPHEAPCERHGSAMSRMSAMGKNYFHSNLDKKFQMESATSAPQRRHARVMEAPCPLRELGWKLYPI